MIDGDDGDLVVIDPIDDGIGESTYEGKSQVLEDLTVEAWHPLNQIECLFDAKQEVVAQPRSLIVVSRFRRGQVVLGLRTDDDGQAHRPVPASVL